MKSPDKAKLESAPADFPKNCLRRMIGFFQVKFAVALLLRCCNGDGNGTGFVRYCFCISGMDKISAINSWARVRKSRWVEVNGSGFP